MLGFLFLVWTGIQLSSTTGKRLPGEVHEYCEDEKFDASCGDGEAVLIEHAIYGRMVSGRCVSRGVGPIGCSVDVKTHLDRWCSGRQQCQVLVSRLMHDGGQPCPRDYRSYLEASYTCVPVISGPVDGCYERRLMELRGEEGYLSSQVTRQSDCGSIDNPWHIRVGSGQRVNLTLYDFSMSMLSGPKADTARGAQEVCLVYAIVKDSSRSGDHPETVCGGRSRVRHIYLSVSSSVEVRLVTKPNQKQKEDTQFMIKYQAVGCADPELGSGSWLRRRGDRAEVGCDGSSVVYHLTCEDKAWIGHYSNCSTGGVNSKSIASTMGDSQNGKLIPNGMSIVIIVGVALCVGLFILLIGVVCLRRLRHKENATKNSGRDMYAKGSEYATPSQGSSTLKSTKGTQPDSDTIMRNSENDYYRTWQLQQRQQGRSEYLPGNLPPPPYHPVTNSGYITGERYMDHVYESPKFERKNFAQSQPSDVIEDDLHVKYFELDPDAMSRRQGAGGRPSPSVDSVGTGPLTAKMEGTCRL